MISGILEWRNERSLGNYPLDGVIPSSLSVLKHMLVDAQFIQFETTAPTLSRIAIEPIAGSSFQLSCTVKFTEGSVTSTVTKTDYLAGSRAVEFVLNGVYLGNLSLGDNIFGSAFEVFPNLKFSPLTLTSIDASSGVFSIDGNNEAKFVSDEDDRSVFFNVCEEDCVDIPNKTALVFNGVTNYTISDSELSANTALKKVNLVGPTDNNLVIAGNEVVRVSAELDRLIFELVGFQNATKQLPVFSTVST